MRRTTLCSGFLLLLAPLSCQASGETEVEGARPNLVFVLADDLGYGDVGALNPSSKIPTPHLNRLAKEGACFTDAHTPSSVCTPTRYGLLTGRYCWRSRLKNGVLNGYGAPLIEEGRPTVADLLQAAGYRTAIFGKWHLGLEWPRVDGEIDFEQPVGGVPNRNGFEHSFIIPASLDFPPYVFIENGQVTAPVTAEQPAQRFPAFLRKGPIADDLKMELAQDRIVQECTDWIREAAQGDAPFFAYLPLTAPHKPVLPAPRYRGVTELGDYADFIVQVDAAVGRVLAALDESGVADNTLIFVSSDNGSFMYRVDDPSKPSHEQDVKVQGYHPEVHTANGPLRGTKADVWEAGHRVPFLVRWPGRVEASSRPDQTVCLTDFYATCADLVGAPPAELGGEDSFSLLSIFRGEERFVRAPVIHHSAAGMFAIRDGDWKLVAGNGSGGRQAPRGKPFEEPFQLFHLGQDLGETQDRIALEPDRAAAMRALLQAMRDAGNSHVARRAN